MGACTSSHDLGGDGGADAGPICLTNVQVQNGQSCEAPEGYLCPVGFPCTDPPIAQQANCYCTSGEAGGPSKVWQCSYAGGAGSPIAVGATPTCVKTGPGMQSACPAGESPGTTCNVAGLVCSYSGELCTGASFPNTDTCQCVGGPDGGLQYACERDLCDPTSDAAIPPPPEAGPPDSGKLDGASDSPADG
jgi:hypothetical protein